jgi:hypothetical protein
MITYYFIGGGKAWNYKDDGTGLKRQQIYCGQADNIT